MQVVCEATQCNSVAIQVVALQNLVKIMSLYYQYMEAYMGPALFAVRQPHPLYLIAVPHLLLLDYLVSHEE